MHNYIPRRKSGIYWIQVHRAATSALSAVSMYAVAGRDSRLPLAGRGKNRSGIELKITSRIYRIPLSTAATRGNGNTAEHSCRIHFYRYRDPRTWKQGFRNFLVYAITQKQIIIFFQTWYTC